MGLLPGSIPPPSMAGLKLGMLGTCPPGTDGILVWFCMYWLICSGITPIFYISLMILSSISLKSSVNSGLVIITV